MFWQVLNWRGIPVRCLRCLLRASLNVMTSGVQPQGIERSRAAYAKDIAILPPELVASIIESAGFEQLAQFFEAGLMHAWSGKRVSSEVA